MERKYRRDDLRERIACIRLMESKGLAADTVWREKRIAQAIFMAYREAVNSRKANLKAPPSCFRRPDDKTRAI